MQIDPVLPIASEIRATGEALSIALDRNLPDVTLKLFAKMRSLLEELLETEPTTAHGASELVRVTADRLHTSHPFYADQLRIVAGRLGSGSRLLSDLIWLRKMADALTNGFSERDDILGASLIRSAIKGAARPVVIHPVALAFPRGQSGNANASPSQRC